MIFIYREMTKTFSRVIRFGIRIPIVVLVCILCNGNIMIY